MVKCRDYVVETLCRVYHTYNKYHIMTAVVQHVVSMCSLGLEYFVFRYPSIGREFSPQNSPTMMYILYVEKAMEFGIIRGVNKSCF